MKVIGIDPGSRFTGWGVVEQRNGRLYHIDSGVLVLDAQRPVAERLADIYSGVEKIVQVCEPQCASVEEVFLSHNVQSALKLGQARGAAIVALSRNGLPINEYSARQIKLAVVGNGKAEKQQVQHMVKLILGLPEFPEENAADALAAAICHLHSYSVPGAILK